MSDDAATDKQVIAELHAALTTAYSFVPDSVGLMEVDRALRRAKEAIGFVPCRSGHTDCTYDCGWCKGTGFERYISPVEDASRNRHPTSRGQATPTPAPSREDVFRWLRLGIFIGLVLGFLLGWWLL